MTAKYLFSAIIGLTFVFFMVLSARAADGTVLVTGNTSAGYNQPGWMFGRDGSTATPFQFVSDHPSIGIGSLYVPPIGSTPANKFIAENFLNTPMADVDSISYDFLIGASGEEADKVHFYMNVYANFGVSDDLKFYDCRYNIVPNVGSTGAYTTVTFDPSQAYPVTQRGDSPFPCPPVPANMDLVSPGSNIRMFALNVGDTSASDSGLDGYLDKVVVSLTSGSTLFDFEPMITVADKDGCKNDGWKTSNSPIFKNQGDCVSYFASPRR